MTLRNIAKLIDAKVRDRAAALTGVKTAPWNEMKKSLREHGRSTREKLQKGAQQAPADAARFEEIERDGREQLIEEAGQALNNAESASVEALLNAQTKVIQALLVVEERVAEAIETFKADCATSNAAESSAADEADAPTDSVKVEGTGSDSQAAGVLEVAEQLSDAASDQSSDQPSDQ